MSFHDPSCNQPERMFLFRMRSSLGNTGSREPTTIFQPRLRTHFCRGERRSSHPMSLHIVCSTLRIFCSLYPGKGQCQPTETNPAGEENEPPLKSPRVGLFRGGIALSNSSNSNVRRHFLKSRTCLTSALISASESLSPYGFIFSFPFSFIPSLICLAILSSVKEA